MLLNIKNKNNTFLNSGLPLFDALNRQGQIFQIRKNPKNWALNLDGLAEIVENRV